MIVSQYIRVAIISLIASLFLVPLCMRLAFKFDILDHPKSRKIHKQPMPKLGGMAMYMAFVIGTLSSFDYNTQLRGILIGASIIMFIGVIDDMRHLRASLRLFFQLVACIVVVAHGVVIKVFPWDAANVFFTVAGIVGITNALNFLDNMDGLAGGIAAICCFGIAAIAYKTGQRWLVFLSISLLGSTLGFLRYNFNPAKVFMGDSGSTFLGFVISSMAIMASWSESKLIAVTIPVLMLGVMIFDTSMITVLRIAEGKVRTFRQWLEHADTDHLSHRLTHMGLSQRETVMFIYIINFVLVCIAISIPKDGIKSAILVSSGFILFFIWGIWKLHQVKMRQHHMAKQRK
ncbi:MAG: undecaprenyl/decaprenyl-phosphate alpha-N-acetylglucosaminyl 1-phosphate transferase [Candidatus Omnitrophica bacterium]|nr:undecaprenyl/decaprenyl-phosphate alpha-N-acetylglucosaminyl 1-phosphate transferase [Candidatus Omnitrophota bacterium]